eukprot:g3253.t1
MNPEARIFSVFLSLWDSLMDWFHFVKHCCEESMMEDNRSIQSTKIHQEERHDLLKLSSTLPLTCGVCRIAQLTEEVNEVKRELTRTNSTLECILSHLQRTTEPVDENEVQHRQKRSRIEDNTGPLLQCLRPLNEMSIKDLLEEWFVDFISQGQSYEGLVAIEARRRQTKTKLYEDSLKTTISRRRHLVEEVARRTVRFGDKEKAIESMENLREEIGKNGKQCSLYALITHLKAQSKQ